MADLVFVSVLVAFFALAVLLVRACERVIGSDEQAGAVPRPTPAAKQEVAA